MTVISRLCTMDLMCSSLLSILLQPPRGLPLYHGDEVCASQWPGELCWRDRKFLVGPPMTNKSKSRGQTKCSPWPSRLVVGRGSNDPTPGKFAVTKPWMKPRPTHDYGASKEDENSWVDFKTTIQVPWKCWHVIVAAILRLCHLQQQ
jgi:hypothetical protein